MLLISLLISNIFFSLHDCLKSDSQDFNDQLKNYVYKI